MEHYLLHPKTQAVMEQFMRSSSHAFLLVGQEGMGKGTVARILAAAKLHVSLSKLADYPYYSYLSSGETKTIPIEHIRGLERFLSRRVPADKHRVILIEDAHRMTVEAQNALLKTLEEPPTGTTIILTATHQRALLPTISSRTLAMSVLKPNATATEPYFMALGFKLEEVKRAMLISGGLPGLMHAVLRGSTEQPLLKAAQVARECIQKSTFERLAMVDSLSKDRQLSLDMLAMLQQMAHLSLAAGNENPIWQPLLTESYKAAENLRQNAQPKLVLTNLMLRLSI